MVPRRPAQPRPAALALPLPAGAVPLRATSSTRTAAAAGDEPEYELLDTGVFDDDRFWVVEVTYAKASPTEVLREHHRREPRPRRGDASRAAHAVVPQHLALGRTRPSRAGPARWTATRSSSRATALGGLPARGRARPDGAPPRRCSATTRPTPRACTAAAPLTRVPEGRHQRPRRRRRGHGQPGPDADQGRLVVPLTVPGRRDRASSGSGCTDPAGRRHAGSGVVGRGLRRDRAPSAEREADEFYAALAPAGIDDGADAGAPPGQRRAGLEQAVLPVRRRPVARRRPGAAPAPAGRATRAATPTGATSTPSTSSPCRTRGSTRGSRPGTSPSTPSPGPTSTRPSPSTSSLVLLREWFLHPNGALPAYEWSFDDVNPPVHALAALAGLPHRRRHRHRRSSSGSSRSCCSTSPGGSTARTPTATTCSAAGSSGLDNICPIDRSHLPPGCGRAGRRHGVDGALRAGHAGARPQLAERRTRSTTTWSSSSSSTSC